VTKVTNEIHEAFTCRLLHSQSASSIRLDSSRLASRSHTHAKQPCPPSIYPRNSARSDGCHGSDRPCGSTLGALASAWAYIPCARASTVISHACADILCACACARARTCIPCACARTGYSCARTRTDYPCAYAGTGPKLLECCPRTGSSRASSSRTSSSRNYTASFPSTSPGAYRGTGFRGARAGN